MVAECYGCYRGICPRRVSNSIVQTVKQHDQFVSMVSNIESMDSTRSILRFSLAETAHGLCYINVLLLGGVRDDEGQTAGDRRESEGEVGGR